MKRGGLFAEEGSKKTTAPFSRMALASKRELGSAGRSRRLSRALLEPSPTYDATVPFPQCKKLAGNQACNATVPFPQCKKLAGNQACMIEARETATEQLHLLLRAAEKQGQVHAVMLWVEERGRGESGVCAWAERYPCSRVSAFHGCGAGRGS